MRYLCFTALCTFTIVVVWILYMRLYEPKEQLLITDVFPFSEVSLAAAIHRHLLNHRLIQNVKINSKGN